ncbi:MAG: SoxR reducing system RseC family protein [Spirochaetales bacterium]|nr:SoxR reducing system RseC family protein [Spirochaetales bacterium]
MIERGTVVNVDGRVVQVRIERQAGCASCAANGACGAAGTVVTALARSARVPSPGESVAVEVSAANQARGVLTMLGLPLVLFAIAYAAGTYFLSDSGEGLHALLGLGGLVAGLALGAFIERGRKEAAMPSLVSLTAEPDSAL